MDNKSAQRDHPVTDLPGISQNRARQLQKLQIRSIGDLAGHFPRRYEDWTSIQPIGELEDGADGVFLGQVQKVPTLFRKGKRSTLQTVLRDTSDAIKGVWFNQPYLQDKLNPGAIYLFRGRVKREGRTFAVYNPAFELQAIDAFPEFGSQPAEALARTFVRPVYPTTQGLGQNLLRTFVDKALAVVLPELEETLPSILRKTHQLPDRSWAWAQIHHPDHLENYRLARRRLAFDELLMLQLGLRLSKSAGLKRQAVPLPLKDSPGVQKGLKAALEQLPYPLTDDQKKATGDILRDMGKPVAMNRLLQGDVGSGKTVVAFLAMHACVLAGRQAVMMAPTSILAKQHEESLYHLFGQIPRERIACLTGRQTAAEKRRIYQQLKDGEIMYLIGTHAVLQKGVEFRSLGLAITDEQHRFGVKQRLSLIEEGDAHVLVMSATPIPRTLGLIVYGDLDVSIIREKPPGRKPVRTYTAKTKDLPRLHALIRKTAARHLQTYIVCPMVNENEDNDLQSAVELYEQLQNQDLPELRIGLLHGQMKEKDKQEIMEQFLAREIDVLVSTTVIEVGVDNPNATLMIIMNAERFGLAQLHQLRGRIGRGSDESICVLQSDVGEGLARERLVTLCKSEDGFEIAEADLKLRGPGDFFGTRQHGLPAFRMANLYEDQELLSLTNEVAGNLLALDEGLNLPIHEALREEALRFMAHREV